MDAPTRPNLRSPNFGSMVCLSVRRFYRASLRRTSRSWRRQHAAKSTRVAKSANLSPSEFHKYKSPACSTSVPELAATLNEVLKAVDILTSK